MSVKAASLVAICGSTYASDDPYPGLLAQYEISLERDDGYWKKIEAEVIANPPEVLSRRGAIECLRMVKRYGAHDMFGETLISSALNYFEQNA